MIPNSLRNKLEKYNVSIEENDEKSNLTIKVTTNTGYNDTRNVGSNNISQLVQKIIKDSSTYYVISCKKSYPCWFNETIYISKNNL